MHRIFVNNGYFFDNQEKRKNLVSSTKSLSNRKNWLDWNGINVMKMQILSDYNSRHAFL